jgi:NADH-quinone oxidoreductase subunit I
VLVDYLYNLGDCMFCQLCVNACNFGAIEFRKDFENAVFNRDALALHLNIPPVLPEAKPKADDKTNEKEA